MKNNKLKQKYRTNKISQLLVIIFFSFSLCSFGLRQRYGFFTMAIFTLIMGMISCSCVIATSFLRNYWYALIISITVLYLRPSSRHEMDTIIYFAYVYIITLTIIFSKTGKDEVDKILKYIKYFSLFISLYITFFRIFPELYFSIVFPLLSPRTADMVLTNSKIGYGAAIGQSYTFADYIMMLGVSLFIGSDLQIQGRKNIFKLLILILCIGILLQGRKGELLATLLTIIFIYIFVFNSKIIKNPRKKLEFLGIIVGFLIIFIPILYKNGLLYRFIIMFERISSNTSEQIIDFSSGRFNLWKIAIKLFFKHPIYGIGWGRFANYATGIFSEVTSSQTIKDVHNCFLQFLCENGIIGTFLILIPLFKIYKITYSQTLRLRNMIEKSDNLLKLNIFSLCIQTYFLILFFLDPVFYNPFYWCSIAIAVLVENFALKEEHEKYYIISKK